MPQPVLQHQPPPLEGGDPTESVPKKKSKAAVAGVAGATAAAVPKKVKKTKKRKESTDTGGGVHGPPKKARTIKPKRSRNQQHADGLTPAQEAAQEQMRKALEEDKYSAIGSIVEDTDSEDETSATAATTTTGVYKGRAVRMDKAALQQAIRKHQLYERLGVLPSCSYGGQQYAEEEDSEHNDRKTGATDDASLTSKRKSKKKKKRSKPESNKTVYTYSVPAVAANPLLVDEDPDALLDRDASSIFGATQGSSSNSIWVECDKCKKWRRLRGAVDEKKLPPKWYCSMNKNDPERARCSAPEEDYDTPHTAESVADARTRKHLRVWVRRLKGNEEYEARQPTLTRGKKRAAVATNKDNAAYEWVRCCNPSCGKWRAVLRFMDAKTNVVDRTNQSGEWYCVMNNWDEKVASCAAPQENLPAVGCPPWVLQDE